MNSDRDAEGTLRCTVCGKDLTDPKNSGDPDVEGDWVCKEVSCRAVHDAEMTVAIPDGGTQESVIYLVREVRRDSATPLRAFPTEEDAAEWRNDHVSNFEKLDDGDWANYYVGMGGKASFPVTEVPYGAE